MELPREQAKGLFFIPDPHVAGAPPGQRMPGYTDQVLAKVAACLERARELSMLPIFLGDLFHWPRENPNSLLVALIELFGPVNPWVVVGNHDKYQARLTPDCSLSVLHAAGVVRIIEHAGPVFRLETPEGATALVGASPDGTHVPRSFDKSVEEPVVWLTHHNVNFPDFPDKAVVARETPGIDWMVNGHIHRPQPMLVKGATRWANPGNITRLTFSRRSLERKPAASIWRPGAEELEPWVVPHLPFEEVFPDQELPAEGEDNDEARSLFLEGLERLSWRRTQEGMGLKQFLEANLNNELPEAQLVWELYQEVIDGQE